MQKRTHVTARSESTDVDQNDGQYSTEPGLRWPIQRDQFESDVMKTKEGARLADAAFYNKNCCSSEAEWKQEQIESDHPLA